jgi:hypothetical protein
MSHVRIAERALAGGQAAEFAAAMDAAEASGMLRVDALVLRLGAVVRFDASTEVRRGLANEYLTLATQAIIESDAEHEPLLVAMRLANACRGQDALLAELGGAILDILDRVPDDLPIRFDQDGEPIAWAESYKNELRNRIA